MSNRSHSRSTMSSRPRKEDRVPRSKSQAIPDNTSVYIHQVPMAADYAFVSSPDDTFSGLAPGWPTMSNAFYPGNSGPHMGTMYVNPLTLSNGPYLDSDICSASSYDVDSPYDAYTSQATVPLTQMASISPPLSQADTISPDLHAPLNHSDLSRQYAHNYGHGLPLTPPPEAMFCDSLLDPGSEEYSFSPLPEPISECEPLGISKLQFANRVTKASQPRPIRSASEKSSSSRSSLDPHSPKDDHSDKAKNNPRNDPRYDVKPDKDGLFHCPYVRDGSCTHKPTKQKCIYAKNLDSHLRPYTCKFGATEENCRNQRFSSNACLFRHEREMHGLHNHGMNPFLCQFQGCERSNPGNGFPRRWNQRDHMKRVHGFDEPDTVDDGAERGVSDASRRRKPGSVSHAVAMKRSGSNRMNPYPAGQHRHNMAAQRWPPRTSRGLEPQNIMYAPAIQEIRYARQPMVNHYPAELYMYPS